MGRQDDNNNLVEVTDNNTKEEDKKYIKILSHSFKKKKFYTIIICICLLTGVMYFTSNRYDNLVYPDLLLYDRDLSGLNEKELAEEINNTIEYIKNKEITVRIEEKDYKLKAGDFIENINYKDVEKEIKSFGKDKNFMSQFGLICFNVNRYYNFDIKINYDSIKNKIDEIYEDTLVEAIEPTINIEGENISIKEGKSGKEIELTTLSDEIIGTINSLEIGKNNDIIIEEKYHKLDPKIDVSKLKDIDTKISTATTYFNSGTGRGLNIATAASKINNTVLMPGEEFSYEKAVNPITLDNGYHMAPVIVSGKSENGVGGGVCQVSTTLYNTQLKAGILPTERYNHSKSVSYVKKGLDATLATGSKDYKFKNTYDYPILIHAYTVGGQLTIEFWSNSSVTKGIEYVPVSFVKGNVANTYLYGYNSKRELIYKEFIDTSIYG